MRAKQFIIETITEDSLPATSIANMDFVHETSPDAANEIVKHGFNPNVTYFSVDKHDGTEPGYEMGGAFIHVHINIPDDLVYYIPPQYYQNIHNTNTTQPSVGATGPNAIYHQESNGNWRYSRSIENDVAFMHEHGYRAIYRTGEIIVADGSKDIIITGVDGRGIWQPDLDNEFIRNPPFKPAQVNARAGSWFKLLASGKFDQLKSAGFGYIGTVVPAGTGFDDWRETNLVSTLPELYNDYPDEAQAVYNEHHYAGQTVLVYSDTLEVDWNSAEEVYQCITKLGQKIILHPYSLLLKSL